MVTVRELHDKATEYSQRALVARSKRHYREARILARKAHGYESQALALIPDEETSEPTLSIMRESVASLAHWAQIGQMPTSENDLNERIAEKEETDD